MTSQIPSQFECVTKTKTFQELSNCRIEDFFLFWVVVTEPFLMAIFMEKKKNRLKISGERFYLKRIYFKAQKI